MFKRNKREKHIHLVKDLGTLGRRLDSQVSVSSRQLALSVRLEMTVEAIGMDEDIKVRTLLSFAWPGFLKLHLPRSPFGFPFIHSFNT